MPIESSRSAGDTDATFHIPERIPLFPLPNVVFFPKTYLPLHIFEPRYREMVADVEAEGQCIGMVLLKEGWEAEYDRNPPIFELGCAGRLIDVQRLPDGRSNILLQGLCRFEVREQFFDRSYRRARVVLKPCEVSSRIDPVVRNDLLRMLARYASVHERDPLWRSLVDTKIGDEVLINSLSTCLDFTPLEKQFLLEADSLLQRARRLIDLIRFKIDERDRAKGLG